MGKEVSNIQFPAYRQAGNEDRSAATRRWKLIIGCWMLDICY